MNQDAANEKSSRFQFHCNSSPNWKSTVTTQVYRNEIAQPDYKSGADRLDEKVMADLPMNSGREVKVMDCKSCRIPLQVDLSLNASGDKSETQSNYKSSVEPGWKRNGRLGD